MRKKENWKILNVRLTDLQVAQMEDLRRREYWNWVSKAHMIRMMIEEVWNQMIERERKERGEDA